jgi:hypothetical protein
MFSNTNKRNGNANLGGRKLLTPPPPHHNSREMVFTGKKKTFFNEMVFIIKISYLQ